MEQQSFLSLGDMLTFIGLIVAVYQLTKPRYLLIWKLSNAILKLLAVLLLSLGYLMPFAAIIAPTVNNIPVFWTELSLSQLLEVSGFASITLGVLIVAFIYSRFNRTHLLFSYNRYKFFFYKYPKKNWLNFQFRVERSKTITTRSAKKFYSITSTFLVRGHIEEVVEMFHANLLPIVRAARQYNPQRFRVNDDSDNMEEKVIGSNYAFEMMLQLLTDDAVMRHICTANRPFLHRIVWSEINTSNGAMGGEFANILYPNLLEHLLKNSNSFLYGQKDDYNGSARFASIYELLTDDKIISRQHIIPGQLTWQISKTDVPMDAYVEVLAKLLERLIDSYKKNQDQTVLVNIRAIVDQVMGRNGVTSRIAFDKKARERYANDIANSVEANILRTIELNIVHNLYRHDDPDTFTNNENELAAKNEESEYDHTTLTGFMAHKVCEVIEEMTTLHHSSEYRDDMVRRSIYDFAHSYSNSKLATRFSELVYERLLDKAAYGKLEITPNLKGYYPNVMRGLLDHLTPFGTGRDKVISGAQEKMKYIMGKELKEALLEGRKMNNDELMKDVLIPDSVHVTINKSKKTVTYYSVNSKGKKRKLDITVTPPVKQ